MALRNAKPALDRIARSLGKAQDSREFLIKNTRGIIMLCSKSIIAVHNGDIAGARRDAKSAKSLLRNYRKKATGDLAKYMAVPEQEYAEASALIAVAEGKEIPSEQDLGVAPEAYVLGLLDCVGELKRMVFDRIRTGETAEAARVFGVMEGLYLQLYTFSMYDKVLKESRRKLDVNRILVEDARSAITEEKRRADLLEALGRLEKR